MLSTNKNEVFTIGEIGINHNGDIDIAKKAIIILNLEFKNFGVFWLDDFSMLLSILS